MFCCLSWADPLPKHRASSGSQNWCLLCLFVCLFVCLCVCVFGVGVLPKCPSGMTWLWPHPPAISCVVPYQSTSALPTFKVAKCTSEIPGFHFIYLFGRSVEVLSSWITSKHMSELVLVIFFLREGLTSTKPGNEKIIS